MQTIQDFKDVSSALKCTSLRDQMRTISRQTFALTIENPSIIGPHNFFCVMNNATLAFFFTNNLIRIVPLTFRDLCKSFGLKVLHLLYTEDVTELLTAGRRSRHNKTRNVSQWATREVRKLRNNAANAAGVANPW